MSSGDHLGSSDDSSPRSFAQSPERILLEPQKSKISIAFRTFYGSGNRDLNAEKVSLGWRGGALEDYSFSLRTRKNCDRFIPSRLNAQPGAGGL